uniref:Uncharacterized protein n=1 Tax=Anguilla anguilla TaxID=7936 RepID=A0A0E9TTN3_ANGAN
MGQFTVSKTVIASAVLSSGYNIKYAPNVSSKIIVLFSLKKC